MPKPELSHHNLLAALAITDGLVKVIGHRATVLHMEVTHAISLVERYPHDWNFRLKKCGKVKWMCAVKRVVHPWQHCYRTTEAPVLQPSIEWIRSRQGV